MLLRVPLCRPIPRAFPAVPRAFSALRPSLPTLLPFISCVGLLCGLPAALSGLHFPPALLGLRMLSACLHSGASAGRWCCQLAPVGLWHACLCLRVTVAALRLCFAGAGEGLAVPFTAALLSLTFSKLQDSTAGLQVLAGWLRGAASAHDERRCEARSCQQQPCLSPA